jgi:ABC-2 type transport system permease protein
MIRISGVIRKSLKEQFRSFWLLMLTVSTAPFFVIVYNLISQSYAPVYDVLILNRDQEIQSNSRHILMGDSLIRSLYLKENQGWRISLTDERQRGEEKLKNGQADLLMIIPENFSEVLADLKAGMNEDKSKESLNLEFVGNISDINYIITSILVYSYVHEYISTHTGVKPLFNFIETPLGSSGRMSDFDLAVPGLLIFSIIMLMLTASVAMITEVENKTMIRLKLSKVRTLELMGGIAIIQILVGFISVLATLGVAASLGFKFQGTFLPVFIVVLLTTVSVIAFSLFIAAFSKTVTQVLIIGNFPLFLFMFFTGAMFPMNVKPWFFAGGYPISLISLMSPSHSVSALKKLLIMQKGLPDIIPELLCLIILCLAYFSLGLWVYRKRHMGEK